MFDIPYNGIPLGGFKRSEAASISSLSEDDRSMFGIKVTQSEYATERSPTVLHAAKFWHHNRNYHNRIQKKLNKKYGFTDTPTAYRTVNGIICHPDIFKQLTKVTSHESV